MNHSASGSFLGTFYQQAEERGYSFPGAGSYNLDKSTVSRPATSCTKPSTLSRRPKISCASMGAARMTASLCGADQLLLEPGPEFGPAPRSEFDDAAGGRGYCTAAFSAQSKRFTAPHQVRVSLLPMWSWGPIDRALTSRLPGCCCIVTPPPKTDPRRVRETQI